MLTMLKSTSKEENGSIFFDVYCHNDDGTHNELKLFVTELEFEDVARVEALEGQDLEELADVLAGCFNPASNAFIEINKAFGKETNNKIIGFDLKVDGVSVIVNQATCQPEKIINRWWGRYRMRR